MGAAAHCKACHMALGEDPTRFASWIKIYLEKYYGPKGYTDFLLRKAEIVKLSKADKKDIYIRMLASLAWLQAQRREGKTGRLDFPSPYENDT